MIEFFKAGLNFNFIAKAPFWMRFAAIAFVLALAVLFIKGPGFGLDFTGGHELLLQFDKPVDAQAVRARLETLKLGEVSVQSYTDKAIADKTYFLVRVQRSQTFGTEEIAALENAFKQKYGDKLKRVRYNAEAGDVVDVEFTKTATLAGVDTSTHALAAVVEGTHHDVRLVRPIGRPEEPRYSIVLKGVDVSIINTMRAELDPKAQAVKVEFVGPTVGKQLRDDGIFAMVVALLLIMAYIALRFDIYFAPGAIVCLFHDVVLATAVLALFGEEFSMATIAGLLTLIGYDVNDTIVVFDRIRETVGKASGQALKEVVNKAINETLSRTLLTSANVLFACICMMIFGRGTVLFQLGLLMFIGVILGTWSSIFLASPLFIYLRENFGPTHVGKPPVVEARPSKGMKKGSAEASPRI